MDQQAFALHHQRDFVGTLPVSLVPLMTQPDLSKFALQAPAPLYLSFEGVSLEGFSFGVSQRASDEPIGFEGLRRKRMPNGAVATLKLRAS